ncbi:DUF4259 domain-containing protein [Streptomyces sp. NPDC004059]
MDVPDAERAVAAAAPVVAQHPDGEPACSNYGPPEPLREFPADLRTLAIDALDQVVAEQSELAELWGETADGPKWRQGACTRVWQASAVRRVDAHDKRQRQCTPAVTQSTLAEVAMTPASSSAVSPWYPARGACREKPFGGRGEITATFPQAVREIDEVVPVNAVTTWVLPSGVTVGR